jgi:hypothetical protein
MFRLSNTFSYSKMYLINACTISAPQKAVQQLQLVIFRVVDLAKLSDQFRKYIYEYI